MYGAGDEILADAALAPDQDRRVRVGDILDDRPDGAHLRASVKERTIDCGIGLLHNAHECLLAAAGLNPVALVRTLTKRGTTVE
jgi:hypothetical protein